MPGSPLAFEASDRASGSSAGSGRRKESAHSQTSVGSSSLGGGALSEESVESGVLSDYSATADRARASSDVSPHYYCAIVYSQHSPAFRLSSVIGDLRAVER